MRLNTYYVVVRKGAVASVKENMEKLKDIFYDHYRKTHEIATESDMDPIIRSRLEKLLGEKDYVNFYMSQFEIPYNSKEDILLIDNKEHPNYCINHKCP